MIVFGTSGSLRPIKSGVPQGSVQRPVLFLIFINFIVNGICCKYKIFADDLKIYLKVRKSSLLHTFSDLVWAQRDIDLLNSRGKSWGLRMNVQKCVAIRFQHGSRVDWTHFGPTFHIILTMSQSNLCKVIWIWVSQLMFPLGFMTIFGALLGRLLVSCPIFWGQPSVALLILWYPYHLHSSLDWIFFMYLVYWVCWGSITFGGYTEEMDKKYWWLSWSGICRQAQETVQIFIQLRVGS